MSSTPLAAMLIDGFPFDSREDGTVYRIPGRPMAAEVCAYESGHTRLNLVPRLDEHAHRLGLRLDGTDVRFPGKGIVVTRDNLTACRELIALAIKSANRRESAASLDADWSLEPGTQIKRTELHRRYGGSNYGGMAPSTTTPNIFLFTDPKVGSTYGYFDGWVENIFHYTGHGQSGDQRFAGANRSTRDYVESGRALRLFRGAGGIVTYLGRFDLDQDLPYYRTDAPERGTSDVRQVIVFRLVPRGDVVRDAEDALQLPDELDPRILEAAVVGAAGPRIAEVEVEAQHTERVVINPRHEPHTAERREQKLVLQYRAHLIARGSDVSRQRIHPSGESKPLFTDLYDRTRNNLVEAKGSGTRGEVRMAIGQLADYRRFVEPAPQVAVLLPERPRADLEDLLLSQGISCVWPVGRSFADNADGAFT